MLVYECEEAIMRACSVALTHYGQRDMWVPYSFKGPLGIYKKTSDNNLDIYIGEMMVEQDPKVIIDFLYNLNNWSHWFKLYKKS